jgi:Ca-activated chloride channel homolog
MSEKQLLKVSVQSTRNQIGAIDVPQVVYLLLDVQAPEAEQFERMPLNLCLVIDRSTSMREERLDRVKAAAGLIIDQLTNKDSIALVSFSDRAEVVAEAGPPDNVAALRAAIRGIVPSGGTEIYQGLLAGANELRKLASDKKINQIILLTDGHTYGDAADCIELAEHLVAENIGMNAFGIGNEWNDQFLDQLVSPSGGQSTYIERPTEIIHSLQGRIHGLEARYAQNMSLAARFPAGVEMHNAFKIAPFAQPLSVTPNDVALGSVEQHSPLTILLEFLIHPQLPGRALHIPLMLKGDIPSHKLRDQIFRYEYKLLVTLEEPQLEDVEAGEVDLAVTRLRRLTTRLLESGHTTLAEQAYAETELLSRMGALSLEGRKRLKYGTRSLMVKTVELGDQNEMS